MDRTDTSAPSESRAETARSVAGSGRKYVSKTAPYLRRGVESGTVTALVGGTGLVGGIRTFLGGKRKRGLATLTLGAAFLAAALAQRRARRLGGGTDVEETDVVDTGPDAEHAGAGLEPESNTESASVDQPDVADTGVDGEDVVGESENEAGDAGSQRGTTDTEGVGAAAGTRTDDVDRLGEAAFDRHSREVPAPQRAFNQGFLAHSTEVFWGVRARDDAVLVSLDYDALQGRDGVKYVASSEIGDDVRELPIPDTVLDHWDEVSGGAAVTGGDNILFVTTDDLAADGLLRVLPSEWADDLSG